jgi:hypothetical protein
VERINRVLKFLFFWSAFSICLSAQQTTEPLTNQRIIELAHGGMLSGELARIIATAPQVSFDLTPTGTDALLKAGIAEEIIKAMAARESGAAPSQPPEGQAQQPYPPPAPTAGGNAPSRQLSGDYISRGDKEIGVSGTVIIPHAATGATSGFGTFRLGYYVAHNSLVGADVSVAADSSGQLYIPSGFYRYVQHTSNPRLFPFVGAAAGAVIAHGGGSFFGTGFTSSEFAAKGEVGIKYFVAPNVSFDLAYNLLYAHISGAGFKDSSASLIVFGFALTF